MYRRMCTGFVLWVGVCIAGALAQSAADRPAAGPDGLLDRLSGRWVMTGTIEGQPTTHDVEAAWVLGHYLQLHEVSREKSPAGTPAYEARVFLGRQPRTGAYVCVWLDNSVVGSSGGVATAEGSRLPFVFKSGQGAFYNTMTYDPETDRWRMVMEGESNGGRTPFADLTLTRLPAPQAK